MAEDGRSATEIAYKEIRGHLLDRRLPAGAPLREAELASLAGVSRTPVREALRRLDAEGLVELLPRRGARVAPWSEQELEDVFALRLRLEGLGARLAATRATVEEAERLQGLAEAVATAARGRDARRFDEITRANNAFHAAVLAAAGDDWLRSSVGAVVSRALVRHTFERYGPVDLRRSLAHHHELADAIAAGDPDWAESVMSSHIFAARRVLLAHRAQPGSVAAGASE